MLSNEAVKAVAAHCRRTANDGVCRQLTSTDQRGREGREGHGGALPALVLSNDAVKAMAAHCRQLTDER